MNIYQEIVEDLKSFKFEISKIDPSLIEPWKQGVDPFVIRLKGEEHPMYGKSRNDLIEFNKSRTNIKLTEIHKEKISIGVKNSEKWKSAKENGLLINKGEKNGMYGKTHSDETKKIIGAKNASKPKIYGRKLSATVKENAIERLQSLPKLNCPHCGKTTDKGNFTRWHGDNCKSANNKS